MSAVFGWVGTLGNISRHGRWWAAVAAVIGLGTTLAGCSSSSSGPAFAIFAPVEPSTPHGLAADARMMTSRLSQLGYPTSTAKVVGDRIFVDTETEPSQTVLDTVGSTSTFQLRPVLCFAPQYSGATGTAPPEPLPTDCPDPQYSLTPSSLNVSTSTAQPETNMGPDPGLAPYPSSPPTYNDANASSVVLVPGSPDSGANGVRYLLGPAGVLGTDISAAEAVNVLSTWLIDMTLTDSGAAAWDRLAQQQFHAYVAIDLDGEVLSAPLTEPANPSFASFGGKVQVEGNFTKVTAQTLAAALSFGPLPVPLRRTNG